MELRVAPGAPAAGSPLPRRITAVGYGAAIARGSRIQSGRTPFADGGEDMVRRRGWLRGGRRFIGRDIGSGGDPGMDCVTTRYQKIRRMETNRMAVAPTSLSPRRTPSTRRSFPQAAPTGMAGENCVPFVSFVVHACRLVWAPGGSRDGRVCPAVAFCPAPPFALTTTLHVRCDAPAETNYATGNTRRTHRPHHRWQ